MNYKQSGVNIKKGMQFISDNLTDIKSTHDSNVILSKIDFSGLYNLNDQIVSVSCDGIGSKIKLAIKYNDLSGLGQDLVAMNVNDILCSGAIPTLFLDYFATHKLKKNQSNTILKSIINACKFSNVTLIGGETSEMPSVYNKNEFDLAGFCVGFNSPENIIDPLNVTAYQSIIGIKSSGPHSNGYSLINKIVNKKTPKHVISSLLSPTKIYTKDVSTIKSITKIYGLAHITGGGVFDNLIRILPNHVSAFINSDITIPPIFKWIQKNGNVPKKEMFKVFNMGIGMVVIVDSKYKFDVINALTPNAISLGYTLPAVNNNPKIFF